ncbi:hypothetical protein AKJ50_00405 [candidate division MSBL1 archaeon SCGC-AAA382A13]|uniref:HTH arsR-type domain-containing protein n=1 Tax=candidate division MSBL1 archaeon SCGC-AAA382A13 TaxID=1698279 RepID=A0A133VGQ6_9EURY|nr:hypothetical protein AKJ50_00405 [candidate division MSBL1 archaeon SCGC-AAA382A13]
MLVQVNVFEGSSLENLDKAGEMFKILSDPTRLKILLNIAEDEKCVHEIARAIDQELSNVSHHLKKMKDKNLVDYRKEGRHKYYRIDDDHVLTVMREGIEHANE